MARDPNLERLIETLTAPAAPVKPKGVGLADYGKELAGGAVQAVGMGLRGVGEAVNAPARSGTGSSKDLLLDASPLIKAGDAISGKGDAIAQSVSPEAKAKIADSTPEGELLHPSTWSLGKDPSLSGYALQTANVLGQVAPVVATGAITKGRMLPTAAVGAALGGGAAGQQEQQRIDQMPQEELNNVPAYKKLLADGADPASARAILGERTGSRAALTTMPVSALDAFTEGLPFAAAGQKALSKVVGTSRLGRMAAGGIGDFLAEGGQEAAEQAAQTYGANQATGENRSLGEDTFQNALLGGLGGFPVGFAGGAMHSAESLEGAHGGEANATNPPASRPATGAPQADTAAPPAGTAPAQSGLGAPPAGAPLAAPTVTPGFTATQNPATQEMEVAPGVVVHANDGPLSKGLVEGAKQGAMDRAPVATAADGTQFDPDTGEVIAPGTPPTDPSLGGGTVNADGTTASVPFMITGEMRRGLVDRGYDRGSIAKMTPDEANQILAQPAPKQGELNEPSGNTGQLPNTDDIDAVVSGYYDTYGVIDAKTTGIIARRLGVDRQTVADSKKRVTDALTAQRDAAKSPLQENTDEAQGTDAQGSQASPQSATGQAVPEESSAAAASTGRDTGDAAGANGEVGIGGNDAASTQSVHAEPGAQAAAEQPVGQNADEGVTGHAADVSRTDVSAPAAAPAAGPITDAGRAEGGGNAGQEPVSADRAGSAAENGGSVQPAVDAAASTESAVEPGQPAAVSGSGGSARNLTNTKWFGTQEKADAYVAKKGLADTHEIVPDGRRFEVRPKADAESTAPAAAAQETAPAVPAATTPAGRAPVTVHDNTAVNPGEHLIKDGKQNIARFRLNKSGTKAIGVKYFFDNTESRGQADEAITKFMADRKAGTTASTEEQTAAKPERKLVQHDEATGIKVGDRVLRTRSGGPSKPGHSIKGTTEEVTVTHIEQNAPPAYGGTAFKVSSDNATADGRGTGWASKDEITPIQPAGEERRTHTEQRESIDALPPEQSETEKLRARVADLERERNTSEVTGLRNKRAFDDDASLGWPGVGAADMDGLKSLNDTIGHEAADAVLKALGDHMRTLESDGVRFYHRSGDEFAARFKDAASGEAVMKGLQDALEQVHVELSDGKRTMVYEGIGLSVGQGDTYEAADAAVNANKAERLASGQRQPPRENGRPQRLRDTAATGVQANEGETEQGAVVPEAGNGQPEVAGKNPVQAALESAVNVDHLSNDQLDQVGDILDRAEANRTGKAKTKPVVSKNTIVSDDQAEKFRAILRAKLGQLNSGLDPEMLQAGLGLAVYHIERGARTFAAYAKAMIGDFGNDIKPFLKSFYMGVKYDPRMSGYTDMSTAAEVEAADVDSIVADDAKENENEHTSTDGNGQAALGTVAAGENETAESSGTVGSSDAGRGNESAAGDQSADGERVSGARSGGSGAAEVHPAKTRTRRRRNAASEARVAGDGEEAQGQLEVTPPAPNIPAQDFKITDETRLGQGGAVEKFNDNVAAIKVLKKIEAENRRATADEQALLARYVGWGGLANAFAGTDGTFKDGWEKRGSALADLLTPKEMAAARRSTRNAHFTSSDVVQGMWSAMDRLGFKGGIVLEPSMGTGNFIGLLPQEMSANTRFVGAEVDSLTARMAAALYPRETVLNAPFQKIPLAENSFDAAIGNPPFGQESLNFQYSPELNGQSIHNQFFIASLDALKPNGVMSMVVSRYLMDKQDATARRMMDDRAELLGAIRLPDSAFKENAGTQVVTDVLFFRKRTDAEIAAREAEAKENKGQMDRPSWMETTKVPDPLGGEAIEVSKYFAENPHMMLGTLERSGSMRFGADVTLRGEGNMAEQMAEAIKNLPANVINTSQDAVKASLERYKSMADSLKLAMAGAEAGAVSFSNDGKLQQVIERETPEGSYEVTTRELSPESPWSPSLYMDANGKWFRQVEKLDAAGKKVKKVVDGKVTRLNDYTREVFASDADVPARLKLGKAAFERLSALAKLRDHLKNQLVLESEDGKPKQIEDNRKLLAAAYDKFQKAYGYVNDSNNAKLVTEMPDGALVLALEHGYRAPSKGVQSSAKKAPILSERVVVTYAPPGKADSAADALAISMAETGKVDLARMASLLGLDEDGVKAAIYDDMAKPLAFPDPEAGGAWVSRNDYLTGLVKRKLEAARAAGLEKNVAELEKVQPEPWGAENVSVALGASWVPTKTYAAFAEHLMGGNATVQYSPLTNTFAVHTRGSDHMKASEWGTDEVGAEQILSDVMNSKSTVVRRKGADGSTYIDDEATALAQIKRKMISAEFSDWAYADTDRREKLVDLFNEKFNNRVARQHDGSHLTLPGKVPDAVLKMRRHQMNAIWRGISERFMLLDHVVGAGKTFTAIARVMERRRMGLARKPMIAVPNHLVEQFAADVYRLYPGAKVLAAGKKDFEKMRRRRLLAKVATGDWDVVIVPHSSFGFIGIAPETEERFLTQSIDEAAAAIIEAQQAAEEDGSAGGFGKPIGVKEAERLKEKLEQRLAALKNNKQDKLLTFEQLGVDDLTVDEAHEFKNLFYTSRLQGVRGMGDKTGSRKALDLYNKVRVLRESPTGAVTFMTGTPISNSAVEMYSMMRYLAADELHDAGLENFDAWRSQFVDAEPAFEPTETGGLKEVTRLGRHWTNMRSLMEMYGSFTDSVSAEDIEKWYAEDNGGARFPIPKVKVGGREAVVIQPTKGQQAILNDVVAGFKSLPMITDRKERNATRLRLMDRARKVALDPRAARGTTTDNEAGGKLQVMADEITKLYHEHDDTDGTQLVFLDRSVPKAKGDDKIIKEYDELQAKVTQALRAGDDEAYMGLSEKLEKFDANEIEELRTAQAGGWNAYQQLKDNLVERGIPADQIRFVQEANNDAQKQALFDAVNAGEVRVLIGSTPRMGAGTNVQQRLVGLHHGDVTWKPSDIEQREGRIIRQGNLFATPTIDGKPNPLYDPSFEATVKAYATERTIDSKMWDLNSQKLTMINGIRKYDGEFSMDFEDEDAVGMAEMAALASGDPLLLERVKLDRQIDKLELLERAHKRKEYGIQGRIDSAKKTIATGPAKVEQYKHVAEIMEEAQTAARDRAADRQVTVEGKTYSNEPDAMRAVDEAIEADKAIEKEGKRKGSYSVEIGGKQYTTQSDARIAVKSKLGDATLFDGEFAGRPVIARGDMAMSLAAEANTAKGEVDGKRVGKLFGLPLVMDIAHGQGGASVALTLQDKDGSTLVSVESGRQIGGEFTQQSMRSLVSSLTDAVVENHASFRATNLERDIANAKAELPGYEAQRGKPFAQAAELTEKRARLETVIKDLAASDGVQGAQADNALDDRSFSKSANAGGGIDAGILANAIRAQVAKWTNAPIVRVVATADELPSDIRNAPDFDDSVEGVHDKGVVYLVADRMASMARAQRVLAHEAIGHYGIEQILGVKGFQQVSEQIAKLRDDGKLSDLFAEIERRYGQLDAGTLASETMAVMAEKGMRNTLMGRVMAAMRSFLRGLGFNVSFSEGDLRQLISNAGKWVAKGGAKPLVAVRDTAFSANEAPQTPEFRRWFGNSQVVDADGKPLLMFHGTSKDADFKAFKLGRRGAWFTANPADASMYAKDNDSQNLVYNPGTRTFDHKNTASRVMPVYLKIENPYQITKADIDAMNVDNYARAQANFFDTLRAKGYDGVKFDAGTWVTLAEPSQIKSATGNRGTFDPANKNMSFSKAPPVELRDDIESAAKWNVKDIVPFLRDKREDLRPGWLGMLTLRQLGEVAEPYLPRISKYTDTVQAMQTRRTGLQEIAAKDADKWWNWQRKNREAGKVLSSVMHDATLAGVDPAEKFRTGAVVLASGDVITMREEAVRGAIADLRKKMQAAPDALKGVLQADIDQMESSFSVEQSRADAYPELKARYDAMPEGAKEIYKMVRDSYADRADAMQKALIERIGGLELPEEERKSLADRVRANFESARIQGPYFPLARFGEYWVAAEKDGEKEFRMMENRGQQRRVEAAYKAKGWTTKAGAKIDMARAIDGASASFMAKVTQTLSNNGVDKDVADEIYQLYLRTLPDLSVRKQFIHRKGVAGYSEDALRAFASHMNHGAYQLARLENSHKMEAALGGMRKDVDKLSEAGGIDGVKAARVMAEIDKRHQWVMNPKDSSIVQKVSALNFAFYLGATPASALVNLTQGAITTFPALAARYGVVKALRELFKGLRQSISTYGHIQKILTGDELRAHEELMAQGAIDKTLSHDLGGMGEGSELAFNPAWRKTMLAITHGFHKAEVFNRESAGLAAYRLARGAGETHEAAVKYAADTIYQTHFDYANANRARFMQSNTAKVIFAFKQYSQHMSYWLWRNFYQSFKGATQQEKVEARKKLMGTLGMTAVFSGAMGMPLMTMTMAIANAFASAFGDDDQPWDAETEFRAFLAEYLGADWAQVAATGPMQAATGLGIAQRTQLDQMWFRPSDQELEGRAQYDYWLEQISGPVGGMFANAARGMQLFGQGHLERGIETAMPKVAKDAMKAMRYYREGVNDLNGNPVVQDVSPYEMLMQAAGFSPAKVSEQYQINNSLKKYEKEIMQRRQSLMNAYAMAVRMRDQEMMQAVREKIEHFNGVNPEVGITANTIRRSLITRQKVSERTVDGINLNPKLAAKIRLAVLGDGGE